MESTYQKKLPSLIKKPRNTDCCHGECQDYMNFMNPCKGENQRMKGPLINILKKWLNV